MDGTYLCPSTPGCSGQGADESCALTSQVSLLAEFQRHKALRAGQTDHLQESPRSTAACQAQEKQLLKGTRAFENDFGCRNPYHCKCQGCLELRAICSTNTAFRLKSASVPHVSDPARSPVMFSQAHLVNQGAAEGGMLAASSRFPPPRLRPGVRWLLCRSPVLGTEEGRCRCR